MRCLVFATPQQQQQAAVADGPSRGVSVVEHGAAASGGVAVAEPRASVAADTVALGVSNDILAMLSPEGEQVAFGRVLKVRFSGVYI